VYTEATLADYADYFVNSDFAAVVDLKTAPRCKSAENDGKHDRSKQRLIA